LAEELEPLILLHRSGQEAGVDAVTATLADHDCPATTIGEVVDGTGRVEIRR